MIKLILPFILIPIIFISPQNQFQQFIAHVNSLTDPLQKTAAVDSFMQYARTQGIPFIEDSTANFIYRGNNSTVTLAGDFNGWNSSNWPLTKLTSTNFWYKSVSFEMDARLDYKFVINGNNWILDPENPKTCAGGFGPNSELAMPMYLQPWEIQAYSNVPKGIVVSRTLYSINLNANYQLKIYLPSGYDSLSTKTYPSVYFQDGAEYISLGKAINVLDNLIDSTKMDTVIAVFVTPNNRNDEYAGSKRDKYRLFFVNELVPYIDANFKTKQEAAKRLVLGDSFGGNISALISYNHAEVFGLCGLHSAAFWPNNYEAYTLIVNGPVKNIKWSSVWGTYESLYTNMRMFRESLNGLGYQFDWLERPEGHSWGLWRATIDKMISYFFPASPSSLNLEEPIDSQSFNLSQNYPNPFNPITKIIFTIGHTDFVQLKVYDVLGNEVVSLVNEEKQDGTYEVEFDASRLSSGIYFYKLNIYNAEKESSSVKKMILLK